MAKSKNCDGHCRDRFRPGIPHTSSGEGLAARPKEFCFKVPKNHGESAKDCVEPALWTSAVELIYTSVEQLIPTITSHVLLSTLRLLGSKQQGIATSGWWRQPVAGFAHRFSLKIHIGIASLVDPFKMWMLSFRIFDLVPGE